MYEYYVENGPDSDIDIVVDHLNEMGSISYFYWFTKQWEEHINKISSISETTFQNLMLKWFNDCLELRFTKI